MSISRTSGYLDGEIFDLPGILVSSVYKANDKTVIEAETDYGIPEECPHCHTALHKHSRRSVEIAHTPMSGRPVVVKLTRDRKRCPECEKLFSCLPLDWIDERRKMTTMLRNQIIERSMNIPFTQVQEIYGISDSTVQRILSDYFAEMDATYKFPLPYSLGLDEVRIGHTFRTTVTNLEFRCLIDFLEKRNGPYLYEYFENRYSKEERSLVRFVCTDMYRPFKKPLHDLFPNATWVIDHFHVVAYANRSMDDIRRCFQSRLDSPQLAKGIKKRLRYTLLKRKRDLLKDEEIKLQTIGIIIPELIQAYELKESFFEIYEQGVRLDAEQAFLDWEASLPQDKLFKPFKDMGKMVHNFYNEIFAYWDSEYLSNGYTECANGIARAIDRRARGMRFDLLRGILLYNPKALKRGIVAGQSQGARYVSKSTGEIFTASTLPTDIEDDDIEELDRVVTRLDEESDEDFDEYL